MTSEIPKIVLKLGQNPTSIPKLKISVNNQASANNFSVQMVPQKVEAPETLQISNQHINLSQSKSYFKIINQFFYWLLRQHERKDPHRIFFDEVTDQIAPGYSLVIKYPMCFNKIRAKIKFNQPGNVNYFNLADLEKDFLLIFTNCISYNTPDTIYHTFGRKMLNFTKKIFEQDRLISFTKELPFLKYGVFQDEIESLLGFPLENFIHTTREPRSPAVPVSKPLNLEDFDDTVSLPDPEIEKLNAAMGIISEETVIEKTQKKRPGRKPKNLVTQSLNEPPAVEDASKKEENSALKQETEETPSAEPTAEEILSNAKLAAEKAREKLAKLRPNSTMGFLKRKADGSINYNILIDSAIRRSEIKNKQQFDALPRRGPHAIPKDAKQPKLIDTIGRIPPGYGKPTLPIDPSFTTTPMVAKRMEKITPIEYLDYGPYGSFAPVINNTMYEKYNSEEMAILRSAYDTPTAALYAESAMNFVQDSSSWVIEYVDRLLDGFTGKKHSTVIDYLENKKKMSKKVDQKIKINNGSLKKPEKVPTSKLNDLKSLKDLGIDISFLNQKSSKTKSLDSQSSTTSQDKPTPPKKHTLADNAHDLKKLKSLQDQRLADRKFYGDKSHLNPSFEEYKLAAQMEKNFVKMVAKNSTPGDVCGVEAVRNHLQVDSSKM